MERNDRDYDHHRRESCQGCRAAGVMRVKNRIAIQDNAHYKLQRRGMIFYLSWIQSLS